MSKHLLAVFILFCLVISCQDIREVPQPENLIDVATMQDITYDIAVLNAARGYRIQELKKNKVNPETYIFDKYGIDSLQFAQNVAYYSADPNYNKALYVAVEKRIEEEYRVVDSTEKEFQRRKDSTRNAQVLARRRKDSIARAQGDSLVPQGIYKAPSLARKPPVENDKQPDE